MSTIKQQVSNRQTKWNQGVNSTDITSVNKYIKFKLMEYEYYDAKDDDLWEQFKEDFTSFNKEVLKACHQPTIYKLYTFLCDHSI